jgi:PII-like signaling protein
LDGFWEKPYSQKPHDLLSFDHPPLMISFVDEDEKVEEALTLREIYKGGLIVKSKVEVVSFKRSN